MSVHDLSHNADVILRPDGVVVHGGQNRFVSSVIRHTIFLVTLKRGGLGANLLKFFLHRMSNFRRFSFDDDLFTRK